jgi:hypothetical protein
MKKLNILILASLVISATAFADNKQKGKGKSKIQTYEITITNLTSGQSFTPILAATHTKDVRFFSLGAAPSDEMADLAEGGATGGLQDYLETMPDYVMDITGTDGGLIGPGQSRTIYLSGDKNSNRLSFAGMLLPSNDSFVAISSMKLPKDHDARLTLAYDAGSELNDELCANIPGPQCAAINGGMMGESFSMGLAEGYVHVSRGISGEGDLSASAYDWRNPVAQVSVRRMD